MVIFIKIIPKLIPHIRTRELLKQVYKIAITKNKQKT